MEIAPMTRRDKILLYVVLMLAFVVLFVRFLLIPGIENHQQADADLREAQDAQTSMQDAIMLAGIKLLNMVRLRRFLFLNIKQNPTTANAKVIVNRSLKLKSLKSKLNSNDYSRFI